MLATLWYPHYTTEHSQGAPGRIWNQHSQNILWKVKMHKKVTRFYQYESNINIMPQKQKHIWPCSAVNERMSMSSRLKVHLNVYQLVKGKSINVSEERGKTRAQNWHTLIARNKYKKNTGRGFLFPPTTVYVSVCACVSVCGRRINMHVFRSILAFTSLMCVVLAEDLWSAWLTSYL